MNKKLEANNQGNVLLGYAPNARKIGVENLEKAFGWTYQFGSTASVVLKKLLNVERDIASEYARKGKLDRLSRAGHKDAFILTATTRRLTKKMYERDHSKVIDYPFRKNGGKSTREISWSNHAHNIEVQLIAIDVLREGDILSTQRELVGRSGAIPDFQIVRGPLKDTIWHEVERTPKYGNSLLLQLQLRNEALEKKRFGSIVWWCSSRLAASNLRKALAQPEHPAVRRLSDGRIVKDHCNENWDPSRLRSVSKIEVIEEARAMANILKYL